MTLFQRLVVPCALSLGMFATSASAAIISYSYGGQTLTLPADEVAAAEAEGLPSTWPAYSGTMVLDEATLPGGTLANATITFREMYEADPDQVAGLVSFDVFPFPGVGGSLFQFTTNADKRIVSWFGDFLDGPPDGRLSSTSGDSIYVPSGPGFLYSAGPGEWSGPAVIPLPATAPLMLAALALAAALRSRR